MNKIYNCDFREGDIPKEAIVITDPPYNIGFKYGEWNDSMSDEDYMDMLSHLKGHKMAIIHYPEETMKYFVPTFGPPDNVMAWCYNGNIPRRFRLINFYNCKPDRSQVLQPYKNPGDKRIKERMEKGSGGTAIYEWFDDIQLVKNVSNEKTIHPCPIPEALAERMIRLMSSENDLIVDPFMGCGTVPAAAKKLNRRYLGFEIDTAYYEEAEKRLRGIYF